MTSSSEDVCLECLTTSTYWSSMIIDFLETSPDAGVTACIASTILTFQQPALQGPGRDRANAGQRIEEIGSPRPFPE